MEKMVVAPNFWQHKKVLVTGHTGFKGGWLCLWLKSMGAEVIGISLEPSTPINLFSLVNVAEQMQSFIADIRDFSSILALFDQTQPEIVIHMAAQALVLPSYQSPIDTYATNVMGTVHILEAARLTPSVKAIVNVTSDKCYENHEWHWGYRENDALGGFDPYSNSKACSELVSRAYTQSYFDKNIAMATARAGNVIGGGDWSSERLMVDIISGLMTNQTITLRNPKAQRPWQHVLDPLAGYLLLAQRLFQEGQSFSGAWNFGPASACQVHELAQSMISLWGSGTLDYQTQINNGPHEAHYLKLDCSKAQNLLGWQPRLDLHTALQWTVDWYKAFESNQSNLRRVTLDQIQAYYGN